MKDSSIVIPNIFSLIVMLVILMVCSRMLHDPSNFMVMSCAIIILASDFSIKWKHSSTNLSYSLALSIYGMVVLVLFAIVIHINIMLNLLDRSYALSLDNSSLVLLLVIIGFSSKSDKSRSKTTKWIMNCSLHLEKFKQLKIVIDEACEWREIAANK